MTLVLIPSRQRTDRVGKCVARALAGGHQVLIGVDPGDRQAYRPHVTEDVRLVVARRSNRGIAFARNLLMTAAQREGEAYPILCDDDILLPGNSETLATDARDRGLAGVGVYFSLYAHFLGIPAETGLHPAPSGLGQQGFCLSTDAWSAVDGFDNRFKCQYEDQEFILRLLAEGYGPWAIHADVVALQGGKRHDAGGISSHAGEEQFKEQARLFASLHPDVVKVISTGRVRVSWKRAHQEAGYRWPLILPPSRVRHKTRGRRTWGRV